MKCLLCDQESWSGTKYCPKHDLSFKERKYNMYRIWDIKKGEFCIIPKEYWEGLYDKEPLLFETVEEAENHIVLVSARILNRDPNCGYDRNNYIIREI